MQSFNRPNLKYELKVKKQASINNEIVTMIKQKFSGQSGIVYCLSRLVLQLFVAYVAFFANVKCSDASVYKPCMVLSRKFCAYFLLRWLGECIDFDQRSYSLPGLVST